MVIFFRMQVVKYSTRTTTQEINTMMDNLNAFRQVKLRPIMYIRMIFSGSLFDLFNISGSRKNHKKGKKKIIK